MALPVKVDEYLPKAVTTILKAAQYDALSVIEQDMGGWKDTELRQAVQAEGRFLVTADKGFADIRARPPGSHAGVLLLRPDREGIPAVVELMEQVLAVCTLDDLAGTVAVVTPRGLLIRRS